LLALSKHLSNQEQCHHSQFKRHYQKTVKRVK
jgi:hypothetical protein